MANMAEKVLPQEEKGETHKTNGISCGQATEDDVKKTRHILMLQKKKTGILATLLAYVFAIPLRILVLFGLVDNRPMLQLTGKPDLVDKSPARPLANLPPKRKHWEESEDEGCSMMLLQDNMEYDSAEDEDYDPIERDSDTPEEEYAQGETEDEEELKCIDDSNIIKAENATRRGEIPKNPDTDKVKTFILKENPKKKSDETTSKREKKPLPANGDMSDNVVEEIGQDALIVSGEDKA